MMKNNHGIQNIELISKYFYYVGLGIGILGMMGTAIISYLNISVLDLIPKCPLYEKTGYYCPGCGGTRAMIAISNGRILESLYYHPFVTYMLICYIEYNYTWKSKRALFLPSILLYRNWYSDCTVFDQKLFAVQIWLFALILNIYFVKR